ncbi:hypothetical protein B0H12DRAFT_1148365, partial [Mycena haematopus]
MQEIWCNELLCSDLHIGTQPSPTRATSTTLVSRASGTTKATAKVQWSRFIFG